MHQLAAIGCPELPVKQARQRWAAYVDREADLDLLDGDALRHTDFNPLNVLLGLDRVWIIDWAWPTRGAAFIDAACLLIRAMAAGHDADQAEALAYLCPGWQQAPSVAIDIFALVSARLHGEIARNDPQPFKQRLAAVAEATDPAVVYVETLAGDIYLEERSDVDRYTLAFDRLVAAALHPDDSVQLIEHMANSLT